MTANKLRIAARVGMGAVALWVFDMGLFGCPLPAQWAYVAHLVSCSLLCALAYMAYPRMRRSDLFAALTCLAFVAEMAGACGGRHPDMMGGGCNLLGIIFMHCASYVDDARRIMRDEPRASAGKRSSDRWRSAQSDVIEAKFI